MPFNVPFVSAIAIAAATILSTRKAEATERRVREGAGILAMPSIYDTLIKQYSSTYSIDPKILKAKIYWESNFNPRTVSPAGAKGLAQMMSLTWNAVWKDIIKQPIQDMFNPEASIHAAAAYFRYLLNKFDNNYSYSMMAYNLGETTVRNAILRYKTPELVIGSFPYETRAYMYGIGTLYKSVKV